MEQGRQKDELQDITLLGNQNNTYDFDYRPDVLHHCALLQANQILQQFIFHIFLISKWWSLNH